MWARHRVAPVAENRTTGATGGAPEQRSAGYPAETRYDVRCDQGYRSRSDNYCGLAIRSQFHTYAVQWTPQFLTFLYDGRACLVDHWSSGLALDRSSSFNEPFSICLTRVLGIGTNENHSRNNFSARHDVHRLGPGVGRARRLRLSRAFRHN
jgi:hypothetical protein